MKQYFFRIVRKIVKQEVFSAFGIGFHIQYTYRILWDNIYLEADIKNTRHGFSNEIIYSFSRKGVMGVAFVVLKSSKSCPFINKWDILNNLASLTYLHTSFY